MEVGVSRLFLLYGGGSMKQITNKEYEEWMKYKEEKAKGHILLPDTIRFICEANDMDPEKIVDTSWKCCRGFARNKTNNEKCLRADVIGSEVLHYSCDFLGGYFSAHFFSISDNSSISSGEGPSKSSSTAM